MKKIKSYDPERQTVIEHLGYTYSIVDLQMMPKEIHGNRLDDPKINELLKMTYPTWHYELADITDGKANVLNRFSSIDAAKRYIRSRGAK